MQYKVICEVSFPVFERTLDITIPINKSVHYVCEMLNKIINEDIINNYAPKENSVLINKRTGQIYDKNIVIKATDIRNGTKLTFY